MTATAATETWTRDAAAYWTVAYRKRTANRFLRVDLALTWENAVEVAGQVVAACPELQVYYTPNAAYDAAHPDCEDAYNILTDTGRRVKIKEGGQLPDGVVIVTPVPAPADEAPLTCEHEVITWSDTYPGQAEESHLCGASPDRLVTIKIENRFGYATEIWEVRFCNAHAEARIAEVADDDTETVIMDRPVDADTTQATPYHGYRLQVRTGAVVRELICDDALADQVTGWTVRRVGDGYELTGPDGARHTALTDEGAVRRAAAEIAKAAHAAARRAS